MHNRLILAASVALALALAGCASRDRAGPVARPAAAVPAPVCVDFSFPIYFETNSRQLTPAARQVVTDAAQRVRGCRLGRIDVVGLADADGAASLNLALSRQRATVVADVMASAGLPRPVFDIDAVGEAGAITPEGRPEPLRRRTEVVIRAAPPASPAR